MPGNLFVAESAIAGRLSAGAPGLRIVMGAGGEPRPEDYPRRPAAAVIYGGFEPMGRGIGGLLARQQWKIVLIVDCVNDPTGVSARAQAGPLIGDILSCLSGWRPTAEHSPMAPVSGEAAEFLDGSARFSLLFTSDAVI